VIAIIAVLASLLAAALASAKNRADSIVCRSNLHQWGLALHMYMADYQAYPPYEVADNGWPPLSWLDRLERYIRTTPKIRTSQDAAQPQAPPKGVEICPGYARLR
jgi:type II secretory pathway pseudopilin PulG